MHISHFFEIKSVTLQYNIVETYIKTMASKLIRIETALVDNGGDKQMTCRTVGQGTGNGNKWCMNACQPSLEALMQKAKLLNVQVDDLLRFDELPEIEKAI